MSLKQKTRIPKVRILQSLKAFSLLLTFPVLFVYREGEGEALSPQFPTKKMSLRPSNRTEVRKKSYKIGVDADEARRRREDNLVEIRKNKREDNLLKKRREGLLLHSQQLPDATQTPAAIEKRVIFSTLYTHFLYTLLRFLWVLFILLLISTMRWFLIWLVD